MRMTVRRSQKCEHGLTYVEVLLAVLLLTACLAPAMDAIKNAFAMQHSLVTNQGTTQCLEQALEKPLSELYSTLLVNAKSTAVYSSVSGTYSFSGPILAYSPGPDENCPEQRNVYILRYDKKLANPFSTASDKQLYIRAQIDDVLFMESIAIAK